MEMDGPTDWLGARFHQDGLERKYFALRDSASVDGAGVVRAEGREGNSVVFTGSGLGTAAGVRRALGSKWFAGIVAVPARGKFAAREAHSNQAFIPWNYVSGSVWDSIERTDLIEEDFSTPEQEAVADARAVGRSRPSLEANLAARRTKLASFFASRERNTEFNYLRRRCDDEGLAAIIRDASLEQHQRVLMDCTRTVGGLRHKDEAELEALGLAKLEIMRLRRLLKAGAGSMSFDPGMWPSAAFLAEQSAPETKVEEQMEREKLESRRAQLAVSEELNLALEWWYSEGAGPENPKYAARRLVLASRFRCDPPSTAFLSRRIAPETDEAVAALRERQTVVEAARVLHEIEDAAQVKRKRPLALRELQNRLKETAKRAEFVMTMRKSDVSMRDMAWEKRLAAWKLKRAHVARTQLSLDHRGRRHWRQQLADGIDGRLLAPEIRFAALTAVKTRLATAAARRRKHLAQLSSWTAHDRLHPDLKRGDRVAELRATWEVEWESDFMKATDETVMASDGPGAAAADSKLADEEAAMTKVCALREVDDACMCGFHGDLVRVLFCCNHLLLL